MPLFILITYTDYFRNAWPSHPELQVYLNVNYDSAFAELFTNLFSKIHTICQSYTTI